MTEPIRWGVMGNATIARVCVVPAIQKSRNGRVIALATRDPELARKTAQENRIPSVVKGYEALLTDTEIDAVYIPLPNFLHHSWAVKALKAGKHVLCEKPMAVDAAQAREMADAAQQAGCLLMEGFMYRFHPRNIRIKALLSQGGIGDPLLIRTAFCFRMPDKLFNDPDNPRMFSGNGGGALLDVGCYAVSTARWLFGDEPISASAQAVFHPSGVDIHAVGALRFPGGRLAAIEASFVSALQQTYCVTGTEGAVELPHDAFIPWEKDASYTVREKDKPDGVIETVPGADEYRLMIEHFCDAVSGKCPLLYSPTDSVLNMRVLDALSSSATTGTTATI